MYIWKNELEDTTLCFQSETAQSRCCLPSRGKPVLYICLEAIMYLLVMLFPAVNELKDFPEPSKVHHSELLIHFRGSLEHENIAVPPWNRNTAL